MTPKELTNSILQYAIQGKLVEQRTCEGTAEDLYKAIIADKKILLDGKKEGKLSSETFKEDELPFDIPDTWKWVRFGHIMINRDAERIPLSVDERDKLSKVYDYYGASGVIDKVDRYLFDKKLLLIGEDGANLLARSTPIAFLATGKYWVNNHAHVLDCNECLLCMEYVMWFINAINLAPYVTGTAQPKMNQQKMNSIPVALPPFAEQKRIVAKLEEILPLIDRYEAAWNKLEEFNKRFPGDMQKTILQLAIQGKLVEQRSEEGTGEELFQQIQAEKQALIKAGKIKKEKPLSEIAEDELSFALPENWKLTKLGNCITLFSGSDFKPEEYNDKGIGTPYITGASSLSNSGVILNRWTEVPRIFANHGDVLLVCKGSGYGKTVICDIEEAHIARQIMAIKKSNSLDMEYIRYFLQANFDLIKTKGQGVIPGIDRGSVLNLPIALPPLAEQKRIVAKLEEILPLCDRLK